jgi:hypothetical protein
MHPLLHELSELILAQGHRILLPRGGYRASSARYGSTRYGSTRYGSLL